MDDPEVAAEHLISAESAGSEVAAAPEAPATAGADPVPARDAAADIGEVGRAPEMTPAEVLMLMGSVAERVTDLAAPIDTTRSRYRHGPAFPTLEELIVHLVAAATGTDSVVRAFCVDHVTEIDTTPALDPARDPEVPAQSMKEWLSAYDRPRRATMDLLRSIPDQEWGRTAFDPRLGDITLIELCRRVVEHELGHLAQVRNLTTVAPLPDEIPTR